MTNEFNSYDATSYQELSTLWLLSRKAAMAETAELVSKEKQKAVREGSVTYTETGREVERVYWWKVWESETEFNPSTAPKGRPPVTEWAKTLVAAHKAFEESGITELFKGHYIDLYASWNIWELEKNWQYICRVAGASGRAMPDFEKLKELYEKRKEGLLW